MLRKVQSFASAPRQPRSSVPPPHSHPGCVLQGEIQQMPLIGTGRPALTLEIEPILG